MTAVRLLALSVTLLAALTGVQAAESPVANDPGSSAAIGKIVWLTDFAEAKKLAKEQHKNLLMDFTGSDWCHWCKKLKAEVFDKPEFAVAAQDFVFVELDYPNDKSHQSAAVQRQNAQLKNDYGIDSFPSIFLTDADGKPFARSGYLAGGPAKYIENLKSLLPLLAARDQALANIAKAQGVEKAKAIDAYISQQAEVMGPAQVTELARQILTLDADGQAGLKAKYEPGVKLADITTALSAKDIAKADPQIAAMLADPATSPANQFHLYFLRGMENLQLKHDPAGAISALEAALAADPKNSRAPQATGLIAAIKKAK